MPLTAISICAVLLAAALAFLRPPCFAAAQAAQPATAPPSPANPAWPHRHRHHWSACTRAWFGQPEAL